jgi:hypothetical protein
MRCRKCYWFVKTTMSTFLVKGVKVTRQTIVCGFNKKPYDDMDHTLFVHEDKKHKVRRF